MKKIPCSLITLIIIALLLIIQCNGDNNITTAGNYPLAVDNEWIYFDGESNYSRYIITGTSNHNLGLTVYDVNYYMNGNYQSTYHYYQDETGLYNYLSLNDDTRRTYLSYPLYVGKEWRDTYLGTEMVYNCTRISDVNTTAGDFEDCYVITVSVLGNIQKVYYFKEEVGFVRFEYPGDFQNEPEELYSYTLN
jgi:hypothetical protein